MDLQMLAVVPPDNIENDMLRFKREVFRSTGFVSVQALPPMQPILFFSDGTRVFEDFLRKDSLRYILRNTGINESGGSVCIGTGELALPPEFMEAAKGFSVKGPFGVPCSGIHSGDVREAGAVSVFDCGGVFPPGGPVNLCRSGSLVLYRFKCPDNCWWESVELEELDRLVIRPVR